jgi:hypothetical protein
MIINQGNATKTLEPSESLALAKVSKEQDMLCKGAKHAKSCRRLAIFAALRDVFFRYFFGSFNSMT